MSRKKSSTETAPAEADATKKERTRRVYGYRIMAQKEVNGPVLVMGTQETIGRARKQYRAMADLLSQVFATSWIERCIVVPTEPTAKPMEVSSNGQG